MQTVKSLILFSIFFDVFLISQFEFQVSIIILYLLFCSKTCLEVLCGSLWPMPASTNRRPRCYVNTTWSATAASTIEINGFGCQQRKTILYFYLHCRQHICADRKLHSQGLPSLRLLLQPMVGLRTTYFQVIFDENAIQRYLLLLALTYRPDCAVKMSSQLLGCHGSVVIFSEPKLHRKWFWLVLLFIWFEQQVMTVLS